MPMTVSVVLRWPTGRMIRGWRRAGRSINLFGSVRDELPMLNPKYLLEIGELPIHHVQMRPIRRGSDPRTVPHPTASLASHLPSGVPS